MCIRDRISTGLGAGADAAAAPGFGSADGRRPNIEQPPSSPSTTAVPMYMRMDEIIDGPVVANQYSVERTRAGKSRS